jgi:hypothetical protein
VLRNWRGGQDLEAAAWGDAWARTALVFTREDGSALHPDLVTDGFQRICRKAKLPPIRQLGHSSLAITADTYTSVVPAVAQAAAEAVADLVPRSRTADAVTPSFPIRSQSSPKEALLMSTMHAKPQVRKGGPADLRLMGDRSTPVEW